MDEIPEQELESHYVKAVADLDEHDLSMLAAWHASLEVGHPIANRDFLLKAFPSLGENRREALKIAAGFRGEEAFDAGVAEEQALKTVLPHLSRERATRARDRLHRPLPLGPARLRELTRARLQPPRAASISAMDCSALTKCTPVMPERARGASQLMSRSSTKTHAAAGEAQALKRQLVDLRLGLAHADERGVDDQLEDVVDGQSSASGAPTRGRCW